MSRSNAMIDLELQVVTETDRAYRVRDADKGCWLPKSQVEMNDNKFKGSKEFATFSVPECLAKEKGLI